MQQSSIKWELHNKFYFNICHPWRGDTKWSKSSLCTLTRTAQKRESDRKKTLLDLAWTTRNCVASLTGGKVESMLPSLFCHSIISRHIKTRGTRKMKNNISLSNCKKKIFYFIIDINVSISMRNNKKTISLWNPRYCSAPAALNHSTKFKTKNKNSTHKQYQRCVYLKQYINIATLNNSLHINQFILICS